MARLAYRRPVTSPDVSTLLDFFETGRRDGGDFDAGIQFALERMLVDPDFILRVHHDQPSSRLSDVEVASRLSFFLWSSIPDDRLLTLAERGTLTNPSTLEQEVRRMLADPRATEALVDNFAAQWLNLRRVEEVVVDPDRYPNYDLSLLQAFQQETELFVGSTIREDRSVVDLLNADYTFVNERLARHYGIAGIYGSRFRRVTLPNRDQRGGLLAEGALLATTSYPDRTSPVLRGKWLLNNIFGLPVPAPPPGVDTNLTENQPGEVPRSIRERLAQHRQNPSCNSCHSVDRSAGVRAGEFRRHRRMADHRRSRASRWTPAARRRAGRRWKDWRGCGRCCSSGPSSFRARSPRNFWPTRSAGESSTTISRRCERSSATPRRTTTAGRRWCWAL